MSVDEELRAIRYVLKNLIREGQEWVRGPSGTSVSGVNAGFARFNPYKEIEIDNAVLRRNGRGNFGLNAAYLKPPKGLDSAVTLLWCRWDLQSERCNFWFHIGMWIEARHFIGFRFEMPESGCNHNYFHSQPCTNMGDRDEKITESLPLPNRNPTFPIAASSALELLLSVVASLYGMDGLRNLQTYTQTQTKLRRGNVMGQALKRMFQLQSIAT